MMASASAVMQPVSRETYHNVTSIQCCRGTLRLRPRGTRRAQHALKRATFTPRASSKQEVEEFKKAVSTASTTQKRLKIFTEFCRTVPSLHMSPEGEKLVSDVCEFYDAWGPHYSEDVTGGKVESGYGSFNMIVERIAALFPCKDRAAIQVLDVGAGTGLLGIALKEMGFERVDGSDGSPGMLEQAKMQDIYNKFYCELLTPDDTEKLGDKETEYDLVVSAGSFLPLHIPGSALPALLASVKENGYLVMNGNPHNDMNEGAGTVIGQMKRENKVRIISSEYYPSSLSPASGLDGTVYVLQKL